MTNSIIQISTDLSTLADGDDWSNVEKICGSRASNLCQLQYLGFDIPKGIVITTNAYKQYASSENARAYLPDDLFESIFKGINQLESITKKQFGTDSLLLLAVSSNFPIPSAICVGLNDCYVQILEKKTNNASFAYDCYRRLIQSYGVVACGISESVFDELLYKYISSRNYQNLSDLKTLDFIQLVKMNKAIISQRGKRHFPQEPIDQLRDIILGMYLYFDNENVQLYFRKTFSQVDECSILVNTMILGGKSTKSGSLVVTTNDPAGGDYGFFGSFAVSSFLDDVMENKKETHDFDEFAELFPKQHKLITSKLDSIIKTYKTPMEIKFVIENERMFAVGIKPEKFGGLGHVTAAMEFCHGKIISNDETMYNFVPSTLDCMMHNHLNGLPEKSFCKGFAGPHGTGIGKICFSLNDLEKYKKKRNLILFKRNIYVDEITALVNAKGIVTANGGDFSRGAYIARSLSIPAAFACKDLLIEEDRHVVSTSEDVFREGKVVTVDFGDVFEGTLESGPPTSILNSDAAEFYGVILKMTRNKFKIHMNAPAADFIPMAHVLCADSIGNFPFDSILSPYKDNIFECIQKETEISEEISTKIIEEMAKVFTSAIKLPVTVQLFDLPLNMLYSSNQKLEDDLRSLFDQRKKIDDYKRQMNEKKNKPTNPEEEEKTENKQPEIEEEEEVNDDAKFDPPSPEQEAVLRAKIEKLEKILNINLNSVHLSFVYPKIFEIQVKWIIAAAKAAKTEEVEPKPKILIPFANEEKDLVKLSSLINSLAKESGIRTDFGCIGISPANIALASKVVNFFYINPLKIFQSGNEPAFTDKSLWQPAKGGSKDLLAECVKLAKKKKKQLPITVSKDDIYTRQSLEELTPLGIRSIATNPFGIVIARVCAAQVIIDEKPPPDDSKDD